MSDKKYHFDQLLNQFVKKMQAEDALGINLGKNAKKISMALTAAVFALMSTEPAFAAASAQDIANFENGGGMNFDLVASLQKII